jgi:alkylation response protein AidB-like acyl-CoA dehydrogenase
MTQSTPPAGSSTLAPERPSPQPDQIIGKQAPSRIEISPKHEPKPLPAVDSDFYHFRELLSEDEQKVLRDVREFMETKVQPIINDYWLRDEFPFELIPEFKKLGYAGVGIDGHGCYGGTQLLFGAIAMEMARVDPSITTFYGVHNGLAMGSIALGGSEEQKQKWLPPMARYDLIGCFALTEPLVGSGTGGGMMTTAKREGDTWVLNGQKKWIGNATWCDLSIVWARDLDDNQVKGFIVENKTPGFSVEKIEGKIGLRVVQNGLITLDNVRVPEENRLQKDVSFRDTALVLRGTRYGAAWEATGLQMGAYENALKYAQERLQFGKPIGSFQLVQDLLAKMISNITACQGIVFRSAQLQMEGKLTDAHAALAKAFCTSKSRETLAYARELLGGNGILVEHNIARLFGDAEAIYSYEGTYQMQHLILGKAITGFSAFV